MRLKLSFEEIKFVSEVARAVPNISPETARAISVCYADLAPTTPVKAVFTIANEQGIKRTAVAATRLALRGPERDEGFGTLSVGTADAEILATAIKSHFGPEPLPYEATELLSRLERTLVASSAYAEQKQGRGRPRSNFEELVAPKVTFATAEPAATEVAAIKIRPIRPLLPPELDVDWYVSELALLEAYQMLRGVGL